MAQTGVPEGVEEVMNMRKLVVFLATALLVIVPLSANALGFGNITQHSSLNEPLDADIELLSATEDDVANLKVQLASSDAFLRAGIDRHVLLNELKFSIKESDGSGYIIHLSTRRPVREPFLNFLLEMDWQNGRMLREYTMLLDPPGLVEKQPIVVEPPVSSPTVETVPTAEAEAPFVPGPVDTPEAAAPALQDEMPPPTDVEPVAEAPAMEPMVAEDTPIADEEPPPAVEVDDSEQEPAETSTFQDDSELFPGVPGSTEADAPEVAVEDASPMMGDLDYGIVKKGDRLWNIAEKMQTDESVTIYQVMMALLRSNPDAFVDGNVNRLKVGHVLRIEDAEMLTSMSHQEAVLEFQSQDAAWEDYRAQFATATQPLIGSEMETEDTTSLDSGGELTLASPDGDMQSSGEGSNAAEAVNTDILTLQDELRQVREDASNMRGSNEALNQKLRDMEDELTQMQRSISIKDDDLASMQQQMAAVREETTEAVAADAASQVEDEAPVEAEMAGEETTPSGELVMADEPASLDEPSADMVTDETTSPVELAEEIASAEAQDEDTTAPMPSPTTDDEGMMGAVSGMLDGFSKSISGILGGVSSLLLFIGLPVLLVLVILVLILMRRRSKSNAPYRESILTGGPSSITSGEAAAETEEESSFLSDFAVSGAGAIQTEDSEVDPLTEADVFMAYGRYEAAEDRLKEAIESEPARQELKVKLLELYHATKNRPEFENTAEAFYASLGDNASEDSNWKKVVGMGSELVPGSPLFSGAGSVAAAAPTTNIPAALSDSQVMDIGLDTGVFDAADIGTSGSSDMDFSLDLGMDSEPAASESTADDDVSEAMDFNLDMGESEPAVAEESSLDAGLDFNLDLGSDNLSEPADEGGLDFSIETADSAPVESSTDSMSMDFDLDLGSESADKSNDELLLDMDIGGELNVAGGGDDSTMDFELDASDAGGDLDIGGGDEVGTKLDLAKAYIDMGDPDGARGILDEVMDEGSDGQKQEAQDLLQQIA